MNLWRWARNAMRRWVGRTTLRLEYRRRLAKDRRKHAELAAAVYGICYLRDRLAAELPRKEQELAEIAREIEAAAAPPDASVERRRRELSAQVAIWTEELETVRECANEAKAGLRQFEQGMRDYDRVMGDILFEEAETDNVWASPRRYH